jgi:hypothetical protein
MKTALLFLLPILLCTTSVCGQTVISGRTITTSSLHNVTEPQAIALGESTVAGAHSNSAWNINPATLAGLKETGAGYNYSDYYFPSLDHGFYSAGVWMGTDIGTFALHFGLFDQGRWQFTFESGASGATFNLADYTIAASYATNILASLSLGASIKVFTIALDVNPSGTSSTHSISGVYVDLGLLYSTSGFLQPDVAHDSLHAGLSLQNIGGDITVPAINTESMIMPAQTQQVGRLLRAGMEYDVTFLQRSNKSLLRGRLTLGGMLLLNEEIIVPGNESSGIEGNGSAGLEAIIYDIVALRSGTLIYSFDNIYGDAGVPTFRLGLGLNLPLEMIGINLPLTIGGDYSYTRTRLQPPFFFNSTGNSMDAFGIHVAYTPPASQ